MEDSAADSPTALAVQTRVQVGGGDFDVPIAATTASAPEMPPDSCHGWVSHLAPNIQPADHLIAENPMIPRNTPLSKLKVLHMQHLAASIPRASLVKLQKTNHWQAAGVDFSSTG